MTQQEEKKNYLSAQEIFDRTAKHLLAQGQRAKAPCDYGSSSVYRTEDGLKCAIGCHIPDDLYEPWIDEKRLDVEILPSKFLPGINVNQHLELLVVLQECHDTRLPNTWYIYLANIARVYGLRFRKE